MSALQQWAEHQAEEQAAAERATRARLGLRLGVLPADLDGTTVRRLSLGYPLTRTEAKQIAKGVAREAAQIAATRSEAVRDELHELCEAHGVDYPESDYGQAPEVARLKDAGWWGRKLRAADWRQYETQKLRLGQVKHFVSDEIAKARTWHRAALRDLLERIDMVRSDGGAIMSLAELAERSTSNPAIRRAEMIVRAKGLARWCADRGMTWTFVTITAPSKYHRMRTVDGKLVGNPKWEGATPRDTQQYLVKVWSRIRAALHRIGSWAAFRTVEPHADGTPHWHLCLFIHTENLRRAKRVIRQHALAEDATEPGAWLRRCTFKDFKPSTGTAAEMADRCIAYLVAYVSKNIDGMKTVKGDAQHAGTAKDGKHDLGPMVESARRVEAWRSLWGIQQFQELGGGKVTAYRELRRLREPLDNEHAERVRQAADKANYCAYIEQSRAVQLDLWTETTRDRLTAAAEAEGIDATTASAELADLAIERNLLNQWGEPTRRWVRGVTLEGGDPLPCVPERQRVQIVTREHTWSTYNSAQVTALAEAAAMHTYRSVVVTLCTNVTTRTLREREALEHRAVALAPGFFFKRTAPPCALDLCQ